MANTHTHTRRRNWDEMLGAQPGLADKLQNLGYDAVKEGFQFISIKPRLYQAPLRRRTA